MQTEEILQWDNLKNFECPKCGTRLGLLLSCKNSKCDFSISQEKFDKVVNARYKSRRSSIDDHYEKNSSDFNNLGRKEIAEDFSDSKFL